MAPARHLPALRRPPLRPDGLAAPLRTQGGLRPRQHRTARAPGPPLRPSDRHPPPPDPDPAHRHGPGPLARTRLPDRPLRPDQPRPRLPGPVGPDPAPRSAGQGNRPGHRDGSEADSGRLRHIPAPDPTRTRRHDSPGSLLHHRHYRRPRPRPPRHLRRLLDPPAVRDRAGGQGLDRRRHSPPCSSARSAGTTTGSGASRCSRSCGRRATTATRRWWPPSSPPAPSG